MYVYMAIIVIYLAVTLWPVDRVAALKCNGYRLEFLLVAHLEKGCVHWSGKAVWGSVH